VPANLDTDRSATAQNLADILNQIGVISVQIHDSIKIAYPYVLSQAKKGDRVLIFGSFYTVGEALQLVKQADNSSKLDA